MLGVVGAGPAAIVTIVGIAIYRSNVSDDSTGENLKGDRYQSDLVARSECSGE